MMVTPNQINVNTTSHRVFLMRLAERGSSLWPRRLGITVELKRSQRVFRQNRLQRSSSAKPSLQALVETGATYLILDPGTVRELELTPTADQVKLTLADKRVGAALDVPQPLLGAFALESLG